MKRCKTSTFFLTLPLSCEEWQKAKLNTLLRVCCGMCNNLIDDRRKALEQMERTREWKTVKSNIAKIHADKRKELISQKEADKLLQLWYQKRATLLKKFEFSEYAFERKIRKWRNHHNFLVNSQIAQNLAFSVWQKFSRYFFGDGKKIHNIPWNKFYSVEGKVNTTGIIFRNGQIKVGKMVIPVKMPRGDGHSSSDIYETEALTHRVKYCRIKRQWREEGWRYFAQIALEGEVPIKVCPTGEVLHPIGSGRVGLDIGTQTLAYSSDIAVGLVELAPAVKNIDAELRRVYRAMDRSRKATNPQYFSQDGTIIHIDKLPPNCLDSHGKRKWVKSKRYEQLLRKLKALYQKQAILRRQQHRELANQVLACGNDFFVEKMDFSELAKRSEARKSKTGKNLCRKRFGKSLALKNPAAFVNTMEDKVLKAGGSFQKINAWEAKASQYNHLNYGYNKKKLSQRWNQMPDGRRIQRDLYSAFLIQNSNVTLNGFDDSLCNASYEHFVTMHNKEIQRLQGVKMPSSAGL